MSYLNQCNCESEKSDLQLELRGAKTKIITLERKLEEAKGVFQRIGGTEIYEMHPSGEHTIDEMGRDVWPARVEHLQNIARTFLSTLEGEKGGKE